MRGKKPEKKFARVQANNGFKSGVMRLERAVIYAKQLEDLGNYDVEVVPA